MGLINHLAKASSSKAHLKLLDNSSKLLVFATPNNLAGFSGLEFEADSLDGDGHNNPMSEQHDSDKELLI